MPPQDSIADDPEFCPLCIEDFDLFEKHWKPCPCGYQICQFCFNKVRKERNDLCPACRRKYDDATIQWPKLTPEQIAEHSQQNQKKKAVEQRQKDAPKRDSDKNSRKHLVGVRVVQRNLVYITGFKPSSFSADDLDKSLRDPKYFGQYGRIQKIHISKKTGEGASQSMGIYVTFEKKEDAQACIQAVNGSLNNDRVLRAQFGTTKYCSAWLKYETCNNQQCTFLHELGDEADSYTREGLSSRRTEDMTQRAHQQGYSHSSSNTPRLAHARHINLNTAPPPQPPLQPPAQSLPFQQAGASQISQVSQVGQVTARPSSRDASDTSDGPALPATANWARNNPQSSRRGSLATSAAASSPAVSHAVTTSVDPPVQPSPRSPQEAQDLSVDQDFVQRPSTSSARESADAESDDNQNQIVDGPSASIDSSSIPVEGSGYGYVDPWGRAPDYTFRQRMEGGDRVVTPPPVDPKDPPIINFAFGVRWLQHRRVLESRRAGGLPERLEAIPAATTAIDVEEAELESGSLALGGEPEDRNPARDAPGFDQRRNVTPGQILQRGSDTGLASSAFNYGQNSAVGSVGSRTITPQQSQGLMRSQGNIGDQLPPGFGGVASQSVFHGAGHSRQPTQSQSRYFNGEGTSGSNNIKVAADPRYMAQQSSMMPSTSAYTSQSAAGHFYGGGGGSGMTAGPPPGLKSAATPPAGMFGQRFGTSKDGQGAHDGMGMNMNMNRTRATAGSSHGQDAGKHLADPSILSARMPYQQQANSANVGQALFGGQGQDDELGGVMDQTEVDKLVADPDVTQEADGFSIPNPRGTPIPSPPPGFDGPVHAHPPPSAEVNVPTAPATSSNSAPPPPGLVAPAVTAPKAGSRRSRKAEASKGAQGVHVEQSPKVVAKSSKAPAAKPVASSVARESIIQDEDFPALAKTSALVIGSPVKVKTAIARDDDDEDKGDKGEGDDESKADKGKTNVKGKMGVITVDLPGKKVRGQKASTSTSGQKATQPSLDTAAATKPASRTKSTKKQDGPTTASSTQVPKTAPSSAVATPTPTSASAVSISGTSISMPPSRRDSQSTMEPNPSRSKQGTAAAKREKNKARAEVIKQIDPATYEMRQEPEIAAAPAPVQTHKKKQKKPKSQSAASTSSPTKTPAKTPPTMSSSEEVVEKAPAYAASPSVSASRRDSLAGSKDDSDREDVVTTYSLWPGGGTGQFAPSTHGKVKEQPEAHEPSPPQSPSHGKSAMKLNESTKTTVLAPTEFTPFNEAGRRSFEYHEPIGNLTQPNSEILQAVMKEAGVSSPESFKIFQPVQNYRSSTEAGLDLPSTLPPTVKQAVSPEDEAELRAHRPVHKIVDGHRVLLSPYGNFVPNLTEAEEKRYLELQNRIADSSGLPTTFTAPMHTPGTGFTIIENRAVPSGPPPYFPTEAGRYPADPVAKMARDEAITAINAHVLSSTDLGTCKHNVANNSPTSLDSDPASATFKPPNATANDWRALTRLVPTADKDGRRVRFPRSYPDIAALQDGGMVGVEGWDDEEEADGGSGTGTAVAGPSNSNDGGASGSTGGGDPLAAAETAEPSSNMAGGAVGSTQIMSVEEAEQALVAAKKQQELLEKKMKQNLEQLRKEFGLE